MSEERLLRVDLGASYAGKAVLHGIRFDLMQGEALGLVGASGAGKTTLVQALLGLLPWRGGRVTGEVTLEGRNLLALPEHELRKVRGRAVALIPQSPMSALNPAITLQKHFDEAWRAHEKSGSGRWPSGWRLCWPRCNCRGRVSFCAGGQPRSVWDRRSGF